ncbi:hypothetical protein T02_3938 [Trichinella nativa]|uniref:Uncharacterized protein n=1 Tax=Trichinella nativa TaxID=6335 RepID=A0A0V1LGC0_9BILA|nr:hypothetical protein T02_3938 [Trichinella nativa]
MQNSAELYTDKTKLMTKKAIEKKAYNNNATDFHYRIQECTEPTRLAKLWDNLRPAKQNADNE